MGLPKHPITISDLAMADLEQLFEYLLAEAGANFALDYSYKIARKIDSLAGLPRQGQRADRVALNLRRLVYKNHLIYYRFDEENIEIVRILDGRQDHEKIL